MTRFFSNDRFGINANNSNNQLKNHYLCKVKTIDISSADFIKCKFIDFLLTESVTCIGNEVMYGINKKVADLVYLKDGKIYAVEIKAQNDNLLKLESQVANYRSVFDYVVIVVTENHIKQVLEKTDSSIRIFIIKSDSSIGVIQRGKKQEIVDKKSIIATITGSYLKANMRVKNIDIDQLKVKLEKKSKLYIRNMLYDFFKTRLVRQYEIFLNEKGSQTHIEDLGALSHNNYVE